MKTGITRMRYKPLRSATRTKNKKRIQHSNKYNTGTTEVSREASYQHSLVPSIWDQQTSRAYGLENYTCSLVTTIINEDK